MGSKWQFDRKSMQLLKSEKCLSSEALAQVKAIELADGKKAKSGTVKK